MALNLNSIDQEIGPLTKDYSWKEVVTYALGVGAGFDELDFVYEKNLKVIPTFSIAAIFEFLAEVGIASNINMAGALHGEQDLIFHRTIPTEGKLITKGAIKHIYDLGPKKGATIVAEAITRDASGRKLYTNILTAFGRLDGGFGGEAPPKVNVEFPERKPDYVVDALPPDGAPLLYRMSGDIFMLHVDPEFARISGFEKPIMHGLCTHGYACRALINSLVPGKPELVRRLACRFSKTLYPGMPIRTMIWKISEGKAIWRVINVKTGDTVIDNGIFEYGEPVTEWIRFDDKVAIVTGAGGGLGRAYALELGRRGAKIVVNDLGGSPDGQGASRSPAQQVVDEIKALSGEAIPNFDNVATVEGGANIVKSAMDAFGRVDILINNAGILRDKSFIKMDPENWNAVVNVHLNGAYNVTRPAFQVMKEQGYGRIVMTTSGAGLYGNFGQANYTSAKLGLVGFMNTIKLEGGKYNIKVNTVAPLAASRLTKDLMPPDMLEKLAPEYVVPLTLYLCTDKCDVSGRVYNVGGGFANRAAIVTGPGAVVKGKGEFPEADDIQKNIAKIRELKGGREYSQLNEQVGDVFAALTKPASGAPEAEKPADKIGSVNDLFAVMQSKFIPDAAKGIDVVFQYEISGDGGGEWYSIIKNGTCEIAKGRKEKATCTIKMSSGDFLDMSSGKLNPMRAYTSGKLKIEGDVMKSQLLDKLFLK